MNRTRVTKQGLEGVRPAREATTGVNIGSLGAIAPPLRRREGAEQELVPKAEFTSYYGQPIINKPTWEAPDIPGYLFLGGLAGASSITAAWAQLTKKPGLARATKSAASAAAGLSLVALVHDLGRRARFFNMLRTFKPSSPMSVGSWLLAGYAPAATASALSELTGRASKLGLVSTALAAAFAPGVATYTAALISNTAVPAWHDAYRYLPFVFAASSAAAASGVGLLGAPVSEARAMRRLAIVGGVAELGLEKLMEKGIGLPGEAYEQARAKRYNDASEALTAAAVAAMVVPGRRCRLVNAAVGIALLAGSALARFGIFEAGVQSAMDPKYTVVPQRRELEEKKTTL